MKKLIKTSSGMRAALFGICLAVIWSLGPASPALSQDSHEGHDHGEIEELDPHAGHDHGDVEEAGPSAGAGHIDEEVGLELSAQQRERFGIVVEPAGGGSLHSDLSLPGEIVFNEDRVVHLVPRVAGITTAVHKTVGDSVSKGEVIAVLDSRELADAKSEYLAAKARTGLAKKYFEREHELREKGVSSEQEFLEAEQAFAESEIEWNAAEQKLHALGILESSIENLDLEQASAITRYEIRSPIDGIVAEKHLSLGESIEPDADIFTIVDMHTVWVNLTIYTKNLAAVHEGQKVSLRVDHSGARALGRIVMVTPFVESSSRSATARIVLDNSDGRWMPGTFVTGLVQNASEDLPVVVSKEAVQNIDGSDMVFVEHEDKFEMVEVELGRSDRHKVEILSGLEPGTHYVTQGAFQLKATVITSNLDPHAGHGH